MDKSSELRTRKYNSWNNNRNKRNTGRQISLGREGRKVQKEGKILGRTIVSGISYSHKRSTGWLDLISDDACMACLEQSHNNNARA
jgi:hypothetical protein